MRSQKGPKISKTSEIAQWIRTEINSGRMAPGERLDEKDLAERFEVSKTPVREALIYLASDGLIDLRQKRGATVAEMDTKQVVAMFELMIELETMAARLAAQRMPPHMKKRLFALHEESASYLKDEEAYDEINKALHETISDSAGNEFLASAIRKAHDRLNLYRPFPFQSPGRIEQSHKEHAGLIELISNGHSEAAADAMRAHLSTSGRLFVDLVAGLQSSR
ncbi:MULTISPECIES: GntR family transcriptional regulator [Agrobacterium]|uniref:GntR family transcriptional regulator n=1 Tax=Agrobacterium rubi TaxID=28099 RepID=A0AAE7R8Q9_9HYPH|nr:MULTISPECIES: GntR family transcriptional regulator [Agrobacterium]MBN7807834.1 GntR family transcriptional regulator [Agrobacterium rosae]NTE89794.1 GntR family transcriptional regulator [Agrobacterium rubi]NTF05356.1 GntR family transcriptional regulator [Agrobacterium rubi]NTF10488.1 GntR family transcriptional regulator [Agrobacterium rubi]NTF22882.1 GntR family transcriptional regulator [Agrobacterium rubi]